MSGELPLGRSSNEENVGNGRDRLASVLSDESERESVGTETRTPIEPAVESRFVVRYYVRDREKQTTGSPGETLHHPEEAVLIESGESGVIHRPRTEPGDGRSIVGSDESPDSRMVREGDLALSYEQEHDDDSG